MPICEMLEAGFTRVGEFHYLHTISAGAPYADLGEMAARIAAASVTTGIGLTLLPCLYTYGGFGNAAPNSGQARFLNSTDRFLTLMARTREIVATCRAHNFGIAPHSLRAVSPEQLRAVTAAFPQVPVHIHAAEQTREVDDCIAALGARPVQWLLDNAGIDKRWCLIHATHMTDDETQRLAHVRRGRGLVPAHRRQSRRRHFQRRIVPCRQGRFGIGSRFQYPDRCAGGIAPARIFAAPEASRAAM